MDDLDFFAVCPPGLEPHLAAEVRALEFKRGKHEPGGVSLRGNMSELYRANLELRGAVRVLVRIGQFRTVHYAQLEGQIQDFPWETWLRPDMALRVDVTTHKSKLYHSGAVKQRFETGIARRIGCSIGGEAPVTLKVRLDHDIATLSLDSSGESLHKRGAKAFVGKASMRETLAALFLRACDYDGSEPLVDPMCGSGTFLLEGAEMAAGLQPGRARHFAFESFANFDPAALASLKRPNGQRAVPAHFFGYDRDPGAIKGATQNAARAGVSEACTFTCENLSDLTAPTQSPGLVIVNPPYGSRIGKQGPLFALYGTLGKRLVEHFPGWRVGIITAHGGLAKATGLDLTAGPPIDNGGIKVKLYQTTIKG